MKSVTPTSYWTWVSPFHSAGRVSKRQGSIDRDFLLDLSDQPLVGMRKGWPQR